MAGMIDDMKDKMPSSDRMKELEMKAKDNKLDEKGKAELERLRSSMQHRKDQ